MKTTLSISEKLRDAAQELIGNKSDIALNLNKILKGLLSWPLEIGEKTIVDINNQKSDAFNTVIYAQASTDANTKEISADKTGCIIDASYNMSMDNLRSSYARIAKAKSLQKLPISEANTIPHTTTTLGIIFAVKSDNSLKDLAEELHNLNQQTHSLFWPDMLIILTQGVITYSGHVPGVQQFMNFLPCTKESLKPFPPAIYITMVKKPTGDYTLNAMCALITGHLSLFSPGTNLFNYDQILKNSPKTLLTGPSYQYNLSGALHPVPHECYIGNYIPTSPIRIEEKKGKLLALLSFLPWQDGGAILLEGELPLEGILIFLEKNFYRNNLVLKEDNIQISSVLPIKEIDFENMLRNITSRTNMIVRKNKLNFIKKIFSEEGASSPYMTRLLMGISILRDNTLKNHIIKKRFDEKYYLVITDLNELKNTSKKIITTCKNHQLNVTQGLAAHVENDGSIRVNENIDGILKKEVESFLGSATRILKYGMQEIAKILNIDISLFFEKERSFYGKLILMKIDNPLLAAYLEQCRNLWSERLISSRNNLDHHSWRLPETSYSINEGAVIVKEPTLFDLPITESINFILDRLICFIEEFTTYCLQKKLPQGIILTEIPLLQRNPEIPLRFCIEMKNESNQAWDIIYNKASFEET